MRTLVWLFNALVALGLCIGLVYVSNGMTDGSQRNIVRSAAVFVGGSVLVAISEAFR